MKTKFKLFAIGLILTALCDTPSYAGRFGGGGGGGFHGGGGGGFHGGGGGGMRMGGGMPSGGGMRTGGGGMARMPSYMGGGNFGGGGARPSAPMSRPNFQSHANLGNAASSTFGPHSGAVNLPRNNSGSFGNRGGSLAGRNSIPGGGGSGERHVWDTPRGGTVVAGGGRNSYTGPRGNSFDGGSGAYVYKGPHGAVSIGGGRGGSITGPNGNQISGGKGGHAVIGPNGNIHASGSKGASVVGPGGKAIAGSHGAVTVGPNGAFAHGGRAGAATGPNGTIAGGRHGAAAIGPNGAIAGGGRYVAGSGRYGSGAYGTHYVAASNLHGQGAYIRNNFGYYNTFNRGWFGYHPGAWFAAGWAANSLWYAPTWNQCMGYVGYPVATDAVYYNYGDNVTYSDGSVLYDGQPYATEADYAAQATEIASQGAEVQTDDTDENEKWQPMGVFAMAKDGETSSNDVFQLAINKDGIVRGNYYDAVTDKTTPVKGALDKDSQRVAWSVDGSPDTVYETGLYNLTQDESSMLVHYGKDRADQFNLFRLPDPDSDQNGSNPNAADGADTSNAPATPGNSDGSN